MKEFIEAAIKVTIVGGLSGCVAGYFVGRAAIDPPRWMKAIRRKLGNPL
jgi:hypothetical protein